MITITITITIMIVVFVTIVVTVSRLNQNLDECVAFGVNESDWDFIQVSTIRDTKNRSSYQLSVIIE